MSLRKTSGRGKDAKRGRGSASHRSIGQRPLVLGALVVGLLVVGIAAYNTVTGSDRAAVPYDVGKPGPGDAAPDFTLAAADGSTFHLAALRGRSVLLYFHEGLGCAPCWQQLDSIEADLSRFSSLGIGEIAAISADPGAYGTLAYGMMNGQLPGHTFILVGPDGTIRWRADYGGAPNFTMYVADDTLLAELRRVMGVSG